MDNKVEIIEVGPRDGFQSVACAHIPLQEKLELIGDLVSAGVRHMEFTSFVSPKAIPQLADAGEITKAVLETYPDLDMFALVPNLRGAKNAYESGLQKVCYVVSLSASHNQANINRTHEQSLASFREIKDTYPDMEIIVDLATAFGCPFEGKYRNPYRVKEFLKDYVEAGMKTCCLCDTIGIADPAQVKGLIAVLQEAYPDLGLMVHFHDTRGSGLANSLAAIEAGVGRLQSALGGLGGCPFAPGASGNLSTEDLVWVLEEMGYETGICFHELLKTAKKQAGMIQGNYSGHQIHIRD